MNANDPNEAPHPELVLRAAQEEPPQRLLDDYTDAIHELRAKNFTFREIAEWLQKFGFDVDHNAVWRAYAKTVPEMQAHQEAEEDEQLEREEAYREALSRGEVRTFTPVPETAVNPSLTGKSKTTAKRAKRKKK